MTKDQTPSREEVIAWAREAGIKIYDQFKSQQEALLIGFAALAYAAGAEAEREACIQVIKQTKFSNWFQADCIEAKLKEKNGF